MSTDVIAIDGPAGSGKSSTARAVAERVGFAHLDSGALYRAFTLGSLDTDRDLEGERIAALAGDLPIRLVLGEGGFYPEVAGADASVPVRRADVTARVSAVSALPVVRTVVTRLLRDAAALHPRGVVADGRDIGTVVFPDARLKVFLSASPEERARRRLLQDGGAVTPETLEAEARRLGARDAADAGRAVAPLRQARDAIALDTTGMGFDDQVDAIVALARKAFPHLDID
ncbi:MAG: (d)CMP kinase [Candidatus Palauibacterales bacterium]|nr:(d)CMP kinase [Candidatus Palauibacterales bacterium]